MTLQCKLTPLHEMYVYSAVFKRSLNCDTFLKCLFIAAPISMGLLDGSQPQ